jgi:hypothetical protein
VSVGLRREGLRRAEASSGVVKEGGTLLRVAPAVGSVNTTNEIAHAMLLDEEPLRVMRRVMMRKGSTAHL